MYDPANAPIRNPRHQALTLDVVVPLLDLTGQTPLFEARQNPEADQALFSLGRANAAGQPGVFLGLIQFEGAKATQIIVTVPKATIEALPRALPIGSDFKAFYGLKLDGFELFGGRLTLGAQANHG